MCCLFAGMVRFYAGCARLAPEISELETEKEGEDDVDV